MYDDQYIITAQWHNTKIGKRNNKGTEETVKVVTEARNRKNICHSISDKMANTVTSKPLQIPELTGRSIARGGSEDREASSKDSAFKIITGPSNAKKTVSNQTKTFPDAGQKKKEEATGQSTLNNQNAV